MAPTTTVVLIHCYLISVIYSTTHKTKEYLYYNHCMDWNRAQSYCLNWGGQLASLTLLSERTYVNNLIKEPPIGSCTNWIDHGVGIWLGALYNGTSSSTVHWFDGTVTPFSDLIWDLFEPNNYANQVEAGIGLQYPNLKWHTAYLGDVGNGFVCQLITTDPPTPVPTDSPTHDPTHDPTIDPTYDPTADPTFDPTLDPT
eukprot:544143_1